MTDKTRSTNRNITIAFVATSVSVMATLLEKGKESVEKEMCLKISVLLFSIVIPCMILDLFTHEFDASKDIKEPVSYSRLRFSCWILSAVGIALAFGSLPNITPIPTSVLFFLFFLVFFLIWLNKLGQTLRR